jgi:uncharacterized protein YcgI (DUF1989 family)
MRKVFEKVMPGKSGLAIEVKKGHYLRIIDLEGKQVCDMAVFNKDNPREKLSTSFSRSRYVPKVVGEYMPHDRLMEGDTLMSTLCRPMMAIVKETAPEKGVHDCHHRMCNRYLYEVIFGVGPQDGCQEIISKVVAQYGILPEDIPDTLDINMRYTHDVLRHCWVIGEPVSRPGDYIEFRAEMDCLVALSVCPLEIGPCNAGKSTPMKAEIYEEWEE